MRIVTCLIMAVFVSVFCVSNASADVLTGLIHHWKFDETSGDIAFDSVGNNDGSLNNWGATEAKWRGGVRGGALDFGDLDNYVVTDLPISLDQYTISFWLNVNRRDGLNPRIVGPIDGLHHWIVIGNEDDLGVGFYYDHGRVLVQDPNQPTIQQWEHYSITLDRAAGNAEVFRDGTSVAAGVFVDDLPLERWVFGHQGDFNNQLGSLDGRLDELRIYDRLLSDQEVQELSTIPEPSCVTLGSIFVVLGIARRRRRLKSSFTTEYH